MIRRPLERYPKPLQRIHWAIALLVIGQLAIAVVLTQLRSLQFGVWVLALHRQAGLLVLLLVLLRFGLAFKYQVRHQPIEGMPRWQRLAASSVHGLFYVLLVAQPTIGLIESWARGDTVGLFGLFSIAAPFEVSDPVREGLLTAHIITATVLLTLVMTHVGAIVFNRLVRRVSVIERMLEAPPTDTLVNRTSVATQMALALRALMVVSLLSGMYAVSKYRETTRLADVFEQGDLSAADSVRSAQVAWKELFGLAAGGGSLAADPKHLGELLDTVKSSLNDALPHTTGDIQQAMTVTIGRIGSMGVPTRGGQSETLKAVDGQLQDIADSLTSEIFQKRTENTEQAARGHDLLVVTMVPTMALGVLVTVLLSRSINGSLGRMSLLVRAVAADEIDGSVEVIGNGELSTLMRDMLRMRAAVEERGRETIAMRAAVAQQEAEATAQAHAFALERTRLAEEQKSREAEAQARDHLDQEAQRRRTSVEFETQVAAIVDVVADTVQELKITAKKMVEISGQTTAGNREASAIARRTSDTAAAIAPAAEQLSSAAKGFREHANHSKLQALQVVGEAADAKVQIDSLNGAAQQIVSIADEISAIARQTSLLAINARIQAALAGESGLGFAVVATEVKELASKTRSAVEGIGAQIKQVTAVAAQSGEFLQRVVQRIESLESAASGICESADSQCASTGDIAKRIADISDSTLSVTQNIDAAQETARNAESMAADVLDAADLMEEKAFLLQDKVANFVLQIQGGGDAAPTTAAASRTSSRVDDRRKVS